MLFSLRTIKELCHVLSLAAFSSAFSKKPQEFTDVIELEKKLAPQHVLFRGPSFPAFKKIRQVYVQLETTTREAELRQKQHRVEMETMRQNCERRIEEKSRALEAAYEKALSIGKACGLLAR